MSEITPEIRDQLQKYLQSELYAEKLTALEFIRDHAQGDQQLSEAVKAFARHEKDDYLQRLLRKILSASEIPYIPDAPVKVRKAEEIVKQTENELILCRIDYVPVFVIFGCLGLACLFININPALTLGVLAVGMVGLFLLFIFKIRTQYVFRRETGQLRVQRLIGKWGRTRSYDLKEIRAVSLSLKDDDAYLVELEMQAAPKLRLFSGNESMIEIAEAVSRFLGLPLTYILGTRRLGDLTQAEVGKALKCVKCGASLRPVVKGLEYVTCDYCGTSLSIDWAS